MPEDQPKLLTPTECADRRGVTRQAMHDAIKDGRVRAIRVGARNFVITEEDCDAYQVSEGRKRSGRRRKDD